MKNKLISTALILVALYCVLNPFWNIEEVYFPIKKALTVAIIILLSSLYVAFRTKASFGFVLMVTAIPLCIVQSLTDLVGMLQTASDLEAAFLIMPDALSTVFTGALLASIGYFFLDNKRTDLEVLSNIDITVCSVFILIWIIWLTHEVTGVFAFFDIPSLQFLIGFILFAIAGAVISDKKLSVWLANASIATMLFGIITTAIFYYSLVHDPKAFGPLLAIGLITSLYGCLVFYLSFLISLKQRTLAEINFTVKNWHIIEAFAFLVFLVYGPPTIWEAF